MSKVDCEKIKSLKASDVFEERLAGDIVRLLTLTFSDEFLRWTFSKLAGEDEQG